MDINLSLSAAPSIPANYLVAAVYESSSPNVVVTFQAFAAPHLSDRNIAFLDVNPVVHIVKIWENGSAAPGGTLRHTFIYNPWFINAQIREDLFLIADTTPDFVSTGIGYADITLKGWKFDLERRGFGTLEPTVEYSFDDATGTWELLATVQNPTPSIEPGEIFVMHFQPRITTAGPTGSTGGTSLFNSVELIEDDTNLDATIMGKAVLIAGTNPFIEITLPDITTIMANRPIVFISEGGTHINASVKVFGSQKIKWLGGDQSELILGQSEQFWLFKWVDPNDASVYRWRVLNPDGHFKTVGQFVDSYSLGNINCHHTNGVELSRTTYKRWWSYVQTLDSSMLVSDADWNNPALDNKGKYSTGDGSTTFRIPLLYENGFVRAVDGTSRKAASNEGPMLLDHKHEQTVGTLPSSLWGIGLISRLIGKYGGSGNGKADLTGGPVKSNGTSINTGNSNHPANTGVYRLIRF